MTYQAYINGKHVGLEFNCRQDAAAYVAAHFKIDLDRIEVEEEPYTGRGESRSWEVSDNSGNVENILGYVVEV